MLQRPIFAYHPSQRLFAYAAGTQTVHFWNLRELSDALSSVPAGGDPQYVRSHYVWMTQQSALVAMALLSERECVTVHSTGEVIGWVLNPVHEGESGRMEAARQWNLDLREDFLVSEVHYSNTENQVQLALGTRSGTVFLLTCSPGEEPALAGAQGHRDAIEALTFSKNGEVLASSGRDRVIQLWHTKMPLASSTQSIQGLQPLNTLHGSEGWPLALSFSHDGKYLASGHMDNGVYLWEWQSEKPLKSARFEHFGWINDVAFSENDNIVATASWDTGVGIFSPPAMTPKFRFDVHKDYAVRVLMIPGTTLLVSASYDHTLSLWDWQAGRLEKVFKGHEDWVIDLVWLGNGLFASLSSDQSMRIWSLQQRQCVAVLGQNLAPQMELDDATGVFDEFLDTPSSRVDEPEQSGDTEEVLDLRSVVQRFDEKPSSGAADAQNQPYTALSMLEEALPGSASDNALTGTFNIPEATRESIPSFTNEETSSKTDIDDIAASISVDHPVESGAIRNKLDAIHSQQAAVVQELTPNEDTQHSSRIENISVETFETVPVTDKAIADEEESHIVETNIEDIATRCPFEQAIHEQSHTPRDESSKPAMAHPFMSFKTPHPAQTCVAVSPVDAYFLTGANGHFKVCTWTSRGERVHTLRVSKQGVRDVGFSLNGRIAFAAGNDHRVHLWLLPEDISDSSADVRHTMFSGHDAPTTSLVLHPTGGYLLSGSDDGTARLWSMQNGQSLAVFQGHRGAVKDVALGHKHAATIGDDNTIRLWNAKGLQVRQFEGYGDLRKVAMFRNVIIWTCDSGQVYALHRDEEPRALMTHQGTASAVAWCPEGAFATGGEDGHIYMYAANTHAMVQRFQLPSAILSLSMTDKYLAAACANNIVYVYKRVVEASEG